MDRRALLGRIGDLRGEGEEARGHRVIEEESDVLGRRYRAVLRLYFMMRPWRPSRSRSSS